MKHLVQLLAKTGLVLITLYASGCSPLATAEVVRWAAALRLENLETLEQRVTQSWATPIPVTRAGADSALMTDCRSYFELTATGFESTPVKYQLAVGAECHALQALGEATPAQRTHLARFTLDSQALGILPPNLALSISNDELRAVEIASAKGLTWPEYEHISSATAEREHALRVNGDGWGSRVEIYGWNADFDADGFEDLLVKVHGWLTEGSYETIRLLLLTRTREGGRLDLVKEYDLGG